jgi:hypothetical protein
MTTGTSALGVATECDLQRGAPLGDRIILAKRAYTTRLVPVERMEGLITHGRPDVGDLVLARVNRLRQHQHLERPDGRRAKLWEGDEIIVAYGNRYAPDQFEAFVPDDLGPCHLVAGGGVAAKVASQHRAMRGATEISPIGLVADAAGRRLNLIDWGVAAVSPTQTRPCVFAVLGTSMNAGKTTTAAAMIRGLTVAGLRVGAAKITGTGSGGDRWAMHDAGAEVVLDFTDVGHPSTFGLSQERIEHLMRLLIHRVALSGVEAIIIELADGLFQSDTNALVQSATFRRLVDGVIFAADSAMAAKAGFDWLAARALPVLGLSGVMTTSPLAVREAAQATGVPTFSVDQLADGVIALEMQQTRQQRAA